MRSNTGIAELASILARAFLRLTDKTRRSVISCAEDPHVSLDVSGPESPDHDAEPATRRAS